MMSFSGYFAVLLRPPRAQSSSCRLAPAKQAPPGTWLQSSALATVTVGLQQPGSIILQVHLRGQPILECSAFHYSLLAPKLTGADWVLVCSANAACGRSFCFRFVPTDGGQHCQEALQELEAQITAARAAQSLRPQQPAVEGAAFQPAQHSMDAAPAVSADAHAAPPAPGATPTEPVPAAAPFSREQEDAGIREAIRRYLHDPGFRAYVNRVEALWDEVEQELLGQADERMQP